MLRKYLLLRHKMKRNLRSIVTAIIISISLTITLIVMAFLSTGTTGEKSLFRLVKRNTPAKFSKSLTLSSPSPVGANMKFVRSKTVKIGLTVCGGPDDKKAVHKNEINDALTLIKSVMISAKLSHVKEVDFHIFVDSDLLKHYLNSKIVELDSKMEPDVKVNPNFYNVWEAIDEFVTFGSDCSYTRLFFPEVLSTMDEMLYLDNSVLVTGNIEKIWRSFPARNIPRLVALAPSNAPTDVDFSDPHPTDFNTGVIYMNLNALRSVKWTEKMMQIFEKFTETGALFNVHSLLNAAFSENLDAVEILPCHYNFQHRHCDKDFACDEASNDASGIQILNEILNSTAPRSLIFEAYKQFDLGTKDGILQGLLKPLKQHYLDAEKKSSCDGDLGPLLFKELLPTNSKS